MARKASAGSENRVTVFEAVNRELREIYVGTTRKQMHEVEKDFFDALPAPAGHWERGHRVDYHSLEFDLTVDQARHFIDGYEKAARRDRWKVLRRPD